MIEQSASHATQSLAPRGVICLLGAAFFFGLPMARQALEMDNPYLHRWVMFTGFGLDICEVRLSTIGDDGARHPVDRFALAEQRNPGQSTTALQFIRTGNQARTMGRRLCAAMGPQPDLRLFARCATPQGWTVTSKANQNLCAARPVEP